MTRRDKANNQARWDKTREDWTRRSKHDFESKKREQGEAVPARGEQEKRGRVHCSTEIDSQDTGKRKRVAAYHDIDAKSHQEIIDSIHRSSESIRSFAVSLVTVNSYLRVKDIPRRIVERD